MTFKPKLKPPITYYGGKQLMLPQILPNIPEHEIYNEPFFGGGAVLFAKDPSRVEVINDLNGEVINFYRVVQMDFWKLNEMIQSTLHSRELYHDAQVVYNAPHMFDPIRRAWAFWILTNQGFSAKIGSWAVENSGDSMIKRLISKKEEFTIAYRRRLERVQIECTNALTVIKAKDSPETFHYLDPPYIGSNQGHYSGYTESQYIELMDSMAMMQGKFLQSSYPSEILAEYCKRYGWHVKTYSKNLSAAGMKRGGKKKVEVLVGNYPLV